MGIFRNDDDAGRGRGGSDPSEGAKVVPLLPLRDIVVFPYMVVPLFVGRAKSIHALEEAMGRDRDLLLCAQREAAEDEPGEEDIYKIGTLGTIVQLLRLPDGTVKVLVEGKARAEITRISDEYGLELVDLAAEAYAGPRIVDEMLVPRALGRGVDEQLSVLQEVVQLDGVRVVRPGLEVDEGVGGDRRPVRHGLLDHLSPQRAAGEDEDGKQVLIVSRSLLEGG